jgi:hypothetical protein
MKSVPVLAAAVLAALMGSYTTATADDRGSREDDFAARLSGYNEVHFVAGNAAATPPAPPALRGAISTAAKGRFKAEINDRKRIITYELSFEGLEGDVTQAHIHFGQRSTVGGIVIWLCQTAANPAPDVVPGTTPPCFDPAAAPGDPVRRANTVNGTITEGQVLAQTLQGINAGEFDEIVRAIRAGATYANVHSALHTPGEIRGHIDPRSGHGNH